jgi:hypothetical protein
MRRSELRCHGRSFPKVGFWEAEGAFETSNATGFIHSAFTRHKWIDSIGLTVPRNTISRGSKDLCWCAGLETEPTEKLRLITMSSHAA